MEIKNKLRVTRGERGGGQWGKEGEGSSNSSSRNLYKGLMNKDNERGGSNMGGGVWVGQERVMGRKWGQL